MHAREVFGNLISCEQVDESDKIIFRVFILLFVLSGFYPGNIYMYLGIDRRLILEQIHRNTD